MMAQRRSGRHRSIELTAADRPSLAAMADRVERLTNLLALLLETARPLSLVEIAAELNGMYPEGLSARRGSFERDKAALREIGVPIESEIVPGGQYAGQTRYWIDRDRYELHDLDLDPDEQRALQVAVAATRQGSASAQEALWKLGVGVAEMQLPVMATMPSAPGLGVLREAVVSRSAVAFRYRDRDREVEPYGLLLRDGFWYLVGMDRGRGERRTYRVDRIDGEVVAGVGGQFERPQIDLRQLFFEDPKLLPTTGGGVVAHDGASGEFEDRARAAVVRVSAARAPSVERDVGTDRVISRGADGGIEIAVPCVNFEAFRSWVLGLETHAEVISPPELRAEVIAWLEQILAADLEEGS
jgi:proteasome accessory factor B